jgi:hypothetical protein
LLAFSTGDSKSEYIIPTQAYSVYAADLDLDEDIDIVVGHNYSSIYQWSGVSILLNDGHGYFELQDSIYLFGGQPDVIVKNLNENPLPEIIGNYVSLNPLNAYFAIVYDFNENNISYFNLFTDQGINYVETGDVNGDSYSDIIIASNNGKFWGILYNDGTGNFSEPIYSNVDYYPTDLKCGDLDNDGRDDIVLASLEVEIYYSTDTGFVYHPIGYGEDQVALADFDLDSDLDIVGNAGFGYTLLTFYENTGSQEFIIHEYTDFQTNLGSLNIADIDNDSLTDIVMESGISLYIFYNEGNYSLTGPSILAIDPVAYVHHFDFADFDGNGFQDIAYTRLLNDYLPNLKILFNDGNGNFVEDPITIVKPPTSNLQTSTLHCYPNPFINETNININFVTKSLVELSIYSLAGEKVKNLINNTSEVGSFSIKWDGLHNNHNPCKPGTYYLSLKVNGKVLESIKIIKY